MLLLWRAPQSDPAQDFQVGMVLAGRQIAPKAQFVGCDRVERMPNLPWLHGDRLQLNHPLS
jgi:hypothetical protein